MKTTMPSTLLTRERFQGFRCESLHGGSLKITLWICDCRQISWAVYMPMGGLSKPFFQGVGLIDIFLLLSCQSVYNKGKSKDIDSVYLCPNLMNLNRLKLSAGLNLEKFNTILVEPTLFEPRHKFKPLLKFLKFGH